MGLYNRCSFVSGFLSILFLRCIHVHSASLTNLPRPPPLFGPTFRGNSNAWWKIWGKFLSNLV